jgi:hypothetical protein
MSHAMLARSQSWAGMVMAELEVAKHGKKVIQLVTTKEHGWAHKLQHIGIEIAK